MVFGTNARDAESRGLRCSLFNFFLFLSPLGLIFSRAEQTNVQSFLQLSSDLENLMLIGSWSPMRPLLGLRVLPAPVFLAVSNKEASFGVKIF